jgi:hypothetical protein
LLALQGKYSERERRGFVAKWQASGMSQAEFCRREGIQEWELSNWKRRELKIQRGDAKSQTQRKKATKFVRRSALEGERFWRAHVFAHAKSGLRRGEYCKEYGLSVNSFKRWRAKFAAELKTNLRAMHLQVANPFVEVHVPSVPPPKAVEEEILEVVLPGGVKIVVTERTPLHLLAQVLNAMQDSTC